MTTKTKGNQKTTNPSVRKPAVKKTKATTKKTAPKKTSTKNTRHTAAKKATPKTTKPTKSTTSQKRPVVQAPDEKSFWTTDGQVLNSIIALNEALNQMPETVYQYHVARNRHDFADWVEVVLDDAACAVALRRAKTAKAAKTVVVRHLKLYDF